MGNLFRVSTAAVIAGALGVVGLLGLPTVLAHQVNPDRSGQAGTVQSIGGVTADGTCGVAAATSNFTILLRNGTPDIVDVSPSTIFHEAGVASATFANVCVGDSAGAFGTTAGTTVSATKVRIELE